MKTPAQKFFARMNIQVAMDDCEQQLKYYASLMLMIHMTVNDESLELTTNEEIELRLRGIQLSGTIENILTEQNLLRAEYEEYEY